MKIIEGSERDHLDSVRGEDARNHVERNAKNHVEVMVDVDVFLLANVKS